MQESPFILTEWQELNSLLYAPLSATKRIQYTCLTVSTNYIALGATSGSIYLFKREPCVFQQLIPLSEGAIYRAQISPDEKTIALATIRGIVCLIALKPYIKLTTYSTEHVGERVTCLNWNDNSSEVYAGDESGKVSVTILSNSMVNGMFQSPSCTLMNLDSKVVQMNVFSSLLLISTLNRCYICDTIQEQYKQIGNKPRDGEFGACFLKTHSADSNIPEVRLHERVSNVRQLFSMNGEVNNEVENSEDLPKIYCARPGSRLWEVTASGVVVKTHQFKEALAIGPLPVYKPSIGKLLKLKKQDQWPVQSINFVQLSVINNKYLFSHTTNGLYVFNPENSEVVLWNDEFPDILMTHIINDKIYLMTSSGVFHCLALVSIDSLILRLYNKKIYKECLEMCQILRAQLVNSVTEQPCDIDIKVNEDLPKVLASIISLIKSNSNTQPRKLDSGIVIVNDGNKNSNDIISLSEKTVLDESQDLEDLEDLLISFNLNGSKNGHSKFREKRSNSENEQKHDSNVRSNCNNDKKLENSESDKASSLQKTICNLQTDLESLHLTLSTQMTADITEKQLEELITLFSVTLNMVKKKYEVSNELQSYLFEVIRSAELNYCNSLLSNLSVDLLRKIENEAVLKQLVKILIDVNSTKYVECCCSFPYPVLGNAPAKASEPKFLEIGKILLNKLIESDDSYCYRLCNKIPYMWREYLFMKDYARQTIPDYVLKQCLQTRDNLVLSIVLPLLDEQQWKLTAQCFENVKSGRCANCCKLYDSESVFSKEFSIDWSATFHLILKKHGPKNTLALLYTISEHLPRLLFDKGLYQSIIFSSILQRHGINHTIEPDNSSIEQNSICSPRVLKELTETMEKDLEEPVNKELFGSGPHHWGMRYNLASSTCPCCTLSLQTPVLLGNNGIALFPCGHAYHVNCMIQKKISRCNLHAQ